MFLIRLVRSIPEFKKSRIDGIFTFFFKKEKEFSLKWKNKYTIHLRNRKEDKDIFRQIFIKNQYQIKKIIPFSVNRIVDAGAFTGLSAMYLNNQFPDASLYCIEPDKENFEMLKKNTNHINNVKLFNGVLANSTDEFAKKDPNAFSYGFMFEKANQSSTDTSKGTHIDNILKEQNWDTIDLLKMDIEGAEEMVFSGETSWLKNIGCLVIELHDYKLPFSSNSFFKAISDYKFNFYLQGENLIFVFQHA